MTPEGTGYAFRVDGRMDGNLYGRFLMKNFKTASDTMAKPRTILYFSKTMTSWTSTRRPPSGLKIMDMMSCHGLPSLQTLTPLSNCKIT
jgi:hypothetical protein